MDLNERIKNAKTNDVKKEEELKMQKQMHKIELLKKIESLTPRITKLIDTANTLIDNGYWNFIETDEWGRNGFRSEGWAHHFGFMLNGGTHRIDSVGICNGGACGDYDFHTTGEFTYMTEWYKSIPCSHELKVEDAERMLRDFDDFETRFFTELESFLAKKGA